MEELNDSEVVPGTAEEYVDKYQAFRHLESDAENDYGEVYLLGSHHASLESAEAIGFCLSYVDPDIIGLEYCDERYFKKSSPVSRPVFSVRTGVIYLAKIAQHLTSRFNQVPDSPKGGEFQITQTIADKKDIPIALIDKSYSSISKDLVERPSLREVFRTISGLTGLKGIMPDETGDINMQAVSEHNEARKERYPNTYKVLVEERNKHMAEHIRTLREEYETSCVVMGAAHIPGVFKRLKASNSPSPDLSEMEIVEN